MERNEQIELEIAAFQGPHIKRARIVLAVAGLLYVWTGYRAYDAVAKARKMMNDLGDGGPQLDQLHHLVNLAYTVVMSDSVSVLPHSRNATSPSRTKSKQRASSRGSIV